jgi:nitrate/nitrite-specific signal transduction histidine kinase
MEAQFLSATPFKVATGNQWFAGSGLWRELHDDFSQRLGILSINLAHLWRGLPEPRVDDRALVREMLKGTNELSSDLHTLSHRLHSSRLEYVGLASALRGLCNDISQTYKIEVDSSIEVCNLFAQAVFLLIRRERDIILIKSNGRATVVVNANSHN